MGRLYPKSSIIGIIPVEIQGKWFGYDTIRHAVRCDVCYVYKWEKFSVCTCVRVWYGCARSLFTTTTNEKERPYELITQHNFQSNAEWSTHWIAKERHKTMRILFPVSMNRCEYIQKQFACVRASVIVCVCACACACAHLFIFVQMVFARIYVCVQAPFRLFSLTKIGNCQQNFNHNQQQYIHLNIKAIPNFIQWKHHMKSYYAAVEQQYHCYFQLKCLEMLLSAVCTDSVRFIHAHIRQGNSWMTMKLMQMKNNYDSN